MKLKKIVSITSIVFLALLISSLKSTSNENTMVQTIPNQKNTTAYLAKYGEYVFNKESCLNCHTLNSKENSDLISLDGLMNKYKDVWLYMKLMEPDLMTYDSKMPSYQNLNDTLLNLKTAKSKLNLNEKEWNDLLTEADTSFVNLKQQYLNYNDLDDTNNDITKQSEMIALIAYLQTIPASKELIKKDSIDTARSKQDLKFWEDLVSDNTSILYKNSSSKENIKKGKKIYQTNCSMCHGEDGGGRIGPNLTDAYWISGGSDFEIVKVITFGGNPGKGMIEWHSFLNPEEIGQLLAYIKSIKGSNPKDAKLKEGKKE